MRTHRRFITDDGRRAGTATQTVIDTETGHPVVVTSNALDLAAASEIVDNAANYLNNLHNNSGWRPNYDDLSSGDAQDMWPFQVWRYTAQEHGNDTVTIFDNKLGIVALTYNKQAIPNALELARSEAEMMNDRLHYHQMEGEE